MPEIGALMLRGLVKLKTSKNPRTRKWVGGSSPKSDISCTCLKKKKNWMRGWVAVIWPIHYVEGFFDFLFDKTP